MLGAKTVEEEITRKLEILTFFHSIKHWSAMRLNAIQHVQVGMSTA